MDEDLQANTRRAYDNRLGFGQNPALLIIDFVQAYFEPSNPLYADVQDALDSALRVRAAARAAGVPVVYTNVVYHPSGINGGRFFQKATPLKNFVAGSPMGAWADGLEPAPDELVISKQHASAFFGTALAGTLVTQRIDSVILTGITTSGCIRASCVDASAHGFIPIVVEDAVGDRHPDPHKANLLDMNAKYGDVVGEAEVLTYLRGLPRRSGAAAS